MGIGVTFAELASMRTAIKDLLPGTGDFYSVAASADGFGGYSEGTTIVSGGSNVPYRLDPLQGEEQLAGGEIKPFYRYILTVPHNYGTVVDSTMYFLAGTVSYRIHSIDNVHGDKSWAVSTRIILERP